MKKLAKLTLKELEHGIESYKKDELKGFVGGGQWVIMDGVPTYLLDEVTVTGVTGTPMTCAQLYDLMQSYGDIATYSGAASTIIGSASAIVGVAVGAESLKAGLTSSVLSNKYKEYCMCSGVSTTDTVFITQTSSYTNWGSGSGPEITTTTISVYDTSANFLFSFSQ